MLVYRMAAGCPTSCRGTYLKLTHGFLHLATVPCVVFGAVASMEYHRLKGLPHLYSLHSWMGFLTISLLIIQVNIIIDIINLLQVFVTYIIVPFDFTTCGAYAMWSQASKPRERLRQ